MYSAMNKTTNYLVTSGCSFSDNTTHPFGGNSGRWPHFLATELDRKLVNYGHGSAGNDYICSSTIYAINNLLNSGVSANEIKVVVMWSGIDREGIFISNKETYNFDDLINDSAPNPVNFIEMTEYDDSGMFFHRNGHKVSSGWLLGSPYCSWTNKNIIELKKLYFKNFYTYENCIFKSFNYFLQLQWFCEIKKISLTNLTFRKIIPDDIDNYSTVGHLVKLINFDNWVFWNKNEGLYEYTRDNKLDFYDDLVHPAPNSHLHYVKNFLCDRLK